MRRRNFTIGLLLATATRSVRAQEPAKHRIAVIAAGPVARIHDPGIPLFRVFLEELRRLGDVEGQNLTVEGYSGGGRPEGFADLAREVVSRNPDVIVASTNPVALAVRAATGTIPIVWIGAEPIRYGLATSLARPGGNLTGVTIDAGIEVFGKYLQILKEAVPSASKVAFLGMRTPYYEQQFQQPVREISQRLEISLIDMLVQESTPSEIERVFAEIAKDRPDAIIVSAMGNLAAHRRLIVELVEKSRLPALYLSREYVEAGGLMAYAGDFGELGRRMADDVHQILNGTRPGDIPIYQPTKFDLVINLKAAKALGLTIPPILLAGADEVIE
jgi:putative tryptophan/tyrosine transport system substrate-binding protein